MYIYNECVKNDAENFSCKFTWCFKCTNCAFNIPFILKEKNGYCFVVDEASDLWYKYIVLMKSKSSIPLLILSYCHFSI